MKFSKDLLVIDFEGFKNPTQIGAVLLDKETLQEKDSFLSYIYADLEGRVSATSGITQEMITDAPRPEEIGKVLYEKFGTDILLAPFVQSLDMNHFQKILAAAGIDFKKYDYHILDLWPVAYIHLLKKGYTGGIRSEEIFQQFGAKPRGLHNALEDCRIAADVLREIVL
jgi:DNA polymerase III epsilon subunit-like protein